MLSKKDPSTKAIIKNTFTEKGKFYYNQSATLSDNRLVLITHDSHRLWTRVKVVSMQGCEKNAVTRRLRGYFRLLAVFPDDSLLITREGMGDNVVRLSSDTLETRSSQFVSAISSVGIIDNFSFFCVAREGEALYLKRYLWDGSAFEEVVEKIALSLRPQAAKSMGQIKALGANRFAYVLKGYNNDEFKILLLEVDVKTYAFKEVGLIKPIQYWVFNAFASGEMVVLPNGRILTYHHYDDNAQIWNTRTLQCVQSWNWAAIEKPKDFSSRCLAIEPFPDSIHLLIYSNRCAYLFNTTTFILKKIELKEKLECNWAHQVLPDGQVLTFLGKKPSSLAVFFNRLAYATPSGPFLSGPSKTLKIRGLDTQEMIDYRHQKEAEFRERLCLYQEIFTLEGIPKDISIILCWYAIASGGMVNATQAGYEIDQSSCLIM